LTAAAFLVTLSLVALDLGSSAAILACFDVERWLAFCSELDRFIASAFTAIVGFAACFLLGLTSVAGGLFVTALVGLAAGVFLGAALGSALVSWLV